MNRPLRTLTISMLALIVVIGTTLAITLSNARATVLDDSLIAHWKLDEATGTVIADAASNNTGEVFGSPVPMTGQFGRALSFAAANQYVQIGNSGNGTTPQNIFSISFWIKTTDSNATIISDPSSGFEARLLDGKIVIKPLGVNTMTFSGDTAVNDDSWHLITITHDSTAGFGYLYVDDSNATTGQWSWPGGPLKPAGLLFNRTATNTPGEYTGKLDDVRVYSKALTLDGDNVIGTLYAQTASAATLPPYLEFITTPDDEITTDTATYEFAHQADADVTCQLDGETFEPCSSPASLTGLSTGVHMFSVIATDELDNNENISHIFTIIFPDSGSDEDQDGQSGIISDSSDDEDQDGAAGVISDPSEDEDQDGQSGIISDPSGDEDQDAPGENTSPILIVLGSTNITLLIGDEFVDAGAHAMDAQDGILTPSIEVSGGPVTTSDVGVFELTYTVTDSGGLSVSGTRTITVIAPAEAPPSVVSDPSGDEDQDAQGTTEEPTDEDVPTEPTPLQTQTQNSSSGSRRVSSTSTDSAGGSIGGGQVLGASTSCSIYLPTTLSYGGKNDPKDVEKLQAFLNESMSSGLAMNGIFGQTTLAAVKKFQLEHKDSIIGPWIKNGKNPRGIATGFVGPMTLWKINTLVCPSLQLPLPVI
ncbi:MAG: DUF5011 domain-containing protein [Candidatus Pacebacteria bacterium]|nr:DUF5011 domain-containing protein [Candidatus Paceibacterota bacterium]